jgi:cytochrome d ubiquinol oxidase subunit II
MDPASAFPTSESMSLLPTYLWALVILASVLIYATLDGFDLGVGMLMVRVRSDDARNGMTACIAPFWDGNETWLVLAGAGLLAGFPAIYANVLGTLPIPLSVLLVSLILRGAGLEFGHVVSPRYRAVWVRVFCAGSWMASFCIGLTGGLVLQISPLRGEPVDWWSPLPWLAGLGMCWMHALLGSVWLAMKMRGEVAEQMRATARTLLVAMPTWPLVLMLAAPEPLRPPAWMACPIWIASVVLSFRLRRALCEPGERRSFVQLMVTSAVCFAGWAATLVGVLNDSSDLSWQRLAAPETSVVFTLYGAALLIPLIVGYSAWGYHVFRGRLGSDNGPEI